MKLIGIAGTNGSGKDSVGEILARKYGYLFVSVTDILRSELTRQGLPPERLRMRELSAQWRRESGLGVLIDKAITLFERTEGNYQGLAIASLRNSGEVDRVHALGGRVIWVDADPRVRYDRVQNRGGVRAVDDHKTFEAFLADEQAEMKHSGDRATLNMKEVKTKADTFLQNNTDSLERFEQLVAKELAEII